jgi:hypothetical protein
MHVAIKNVNNVIVLFNLPHNYIDFSMSLCGYFFPYLNNSKISFENSESI